MSDTSGDVVIWLPVGGKCNSRCTVCGGAGRRPVTVEDVTVAAEVARPSVLVLTGPGEPTIRRDLESLVHAARRAGASNVALVTNARTLSYTKMCGAVTSLGFSWVVVSVLHPEPAVHDEMACSPGAFDQGLSGLRNLSALAHLHGTRIMVRTVPHDRLAGHVDAMASLAAREGASHLWIDGEPDDALREEARGARALPVVVGSDVERILVREPRDERSREGWVPARMDAEDGSVTLVVRTGCRNGCNFCTTRIIQERNRAAWPLDDLSVFHDSLEAGRREGREILRFVAVEPLEHPDLPGFVARARDMGFTRIEAMTSGRALADRDWASRLREAGLTGVEIPLLGPTAEVHDVVAGSRGSFDETIAGIRNAVDLFLTTHHLVIVEQNLDHVMDTIRMARSLGLGDPASVLVPAPSSTDPRDYAPFIPTMTRIARVLSSLDREVRDLLLGRGIAMHVPPCVIERTPGLYGPPVRSALPRPREEIRWGRIEEPGTALKIREPCPLAARCSAGDRCPGYHGLYALVHGVDEFVPLP